MISVLFMSKLFLTVENWAKPLSANHEKGSSFSAKIWQHHDTILHSGAITLCKTTSLVVLF